MTSSGITTEYEAQRLENIRKKTEFLAQIDAEYGVLDLKNKLLTTKKRKSSSQIQAPVRKSSRIEERKSAHDDTSHGSSDMGINSQRPAPGNYGGNLRVNAGKTVGKADLAAAKSFGFIHGVPVGTWCPQRQGFHENLVHRPLVAGIFGDENGAYSIALSGGYADDVDQGNKFTFTGEGGRNLKMKGNKKANLRTAPQSKDQVLTKGNLALKTSCETGEPVRVVRGYKGKWEGAPKEGYRFDGLYRVVSWREQVGVEGHKVICFGLVRLSDQPDIDLLAGPGSRLGDRLKNASSEELATTSVDTKSKSKSKDTDAVVKEEEGGGGVV